MADLTPERLEDISREFADWVVDVKLSGMPNMHPVKEYLALLSMASRTLASEAKLADAERVVKAGRTMLGDCIVVGTSGSESLPRFAAELDAYTAKHGGNDG